MAFKPGDRVRCRDPETGQWREGVYRRLLPAIAPSYPRTCPHEVVLDEAQEVVLNDRKVVTDLWLSDDANIERKKERK